MRHFLGWPFCILYSPFECFATQTEKMYGKIPLCTPKPVAETGEYEQAEGNDLSLKRAVEKSQFSSRFGSHSSSHIPAEPFCEQFPDT